MSSTSSKSSKKVKKAKAIAIVEEKPKSNFLTYYFCCFCILPKRSRKLKRKLEKERLERPNSVETDEDDDEEEDDESILYDASKKSAAIKIQSLVRGIQTRALMNEYWKEALEETNAHWLRIVRARELAWLIEERKLVARKQFVLQYVDDIFATSMSFFSQTSQASTEIQRLWRGHRSRSQKVLTIMPPPAKKKKPRFPPPKVIPRPRFSQATLRRVWSRRDFRPEGGKWLHTTDFGHLEYDMWEYIDNPPAGNAQGMRLNKVHAVARNDREVQALTGDKHAWVGLPVGVETNEDYRLKLKQAEPENVARLKSKSPYNAPVVNWDKFEATSKEDRKKRKAQVARNVARNGGSSSERSSSAGSASGSETESGGESGSNSGEDEGEEEKNTQSPHRYMNEKKLVKKLEKFGYDPATMDPFESRGLARLGTYSYDIHTGRRIRHKGNNRWIGANDPTFEVQYDLPPQAAVAQEENEDDSDQENANIVAEMGEGSLTAARPKVFYHRSGAVTVSNPSLLNKKSRFLREHRSMFLDNYTHHNLSDYSGLLSSTYFDLTVHAQGLQRQESITESVADDDITEFNYIQSPPVPLGRTKTGFSQSFLTESAAGLAKTKSDSRLYPAANVPQSGADGGLTGLGGSILSYDSAGVPTNVRYTADGTPIRGARKPYSRGAGGSTAPLMPYASVAESYKGQPGSHLSSGPNGRSNTKRGLLLEQHSQSQLDVSGTSDVSGAHKWKASAWGKLKQGVESFNQVSAADPSLRNKVFQAALQGSLASGSVSAYEDGDLDFAGQREQNDQGSDSGDSDEEMWRSRSLYKPNKNAVNKLGVWPRPPAKNYKLRYTWIPQPLVHNAVNNLYHEKTVWEYRKDASESNPHDFKKEILQGKQRHQKRVEKSTMLSIMSDSNTNSRLDASSRRTNTSASLVGFGVSYPFGVLSPTEGSMASSKYYKNFVRDGQGGSPSQMAGISGSPNQGHGGSVMITQLDDEESSLGSGSMIEEDAPPLSVEAAAQQQRQMFKKGSQMSFSLRSGDGKSATYDVLSVDSRSPVSKSHSPSGRASPVLMSSSANVSLPPSPGKQLAFQFPSPKPRQGTFMGMQVGAGEFDMNSLISSPGASVTAGIESVGGLGSGNGSTSGWDSIAGAPTSAFYSAKITSKSASKLVPHKEAADEAEFSHGLSSGSYLAEKPEELSAEQHARAMFVDKRSTTPKDLRANHYMPKQQRVTIKEPTDEDAHYILPLAPADTSPSAGGTSKKFRFKPTASRNTVPPPSEPTPAKLQSSIKPSLTPSTNTGASAFGSQKLMHEGSAGSIKRPPPPNGPPPDYMISSKVNISSVASGDKGNKASPKSSSKKLSREDSIHKYHFL